MQNELADWTIHRGGHSHCVKAAGVRDGAGMGHRGLNAWPYCSAKWEGHVGSHRGPENPSGKEVHVLG